MNQIETYGNALAALEIALNLVNTEILILADLAESNPPTSESAPKVHELILQQQDGLIIKAEIIVKDLRQLISVLNATGTA